MTTPPKARLYRTSRDESAAAVERASGAVETARKVQTLRDLIARLFSDGMLRDLRELFEDF